MNVRAVLWKTLLILGVAVCLETGAGAVGGPDAFEAPVEEALQQAVAALGKEGVKLTSAEFVAGQEEKPPEAVAAAGAEFVAAWREYRRVLSLKKNSHLLDSVNDKDGVNVSGGKGQGYFQLREEVLNGKQSPQPEQMARFYYSDGGWCGTPGVSFDYANRQVVLLACLRHRRFGDATEILIKEIRPDPLLAGLLSALGFDWRKVAAGAWLDGHYGALEYLCHDASDEAAGLVLRWAELHWEKAVAEADRHRLAGELPFSSASPPEPQMPALEMRELLAGSSTVSPATKKRIAAFLASNGLRYLGAERWLDRLPKGAARWLQPIARAGLADPRNQVKQRAEEAFHDAGETSVKAKLTPPAIYRLFVNDTLWTRESFPNRYPHFTFTYGPAGQEGKSSGSQYAESDGLITMEADRFFPEHVIRDAFFYGPGSDDWNSGDEPWFQVAIPLPPAYGQVTDLRVETVAVTISPRLPRAVADGEVRFGQVDFTPATGHEPPGDRHHFLILKEGQPLFLPAVQPGDYWLRVQAHGAVLPAWEKIRVTAENTQFEPPLEAGADVFLSLREQGKSEPGDFAARVGGFFWYPSARILELQRDGRDFPLDQRVQSVPTRVLENRFLKDQRIPAGWLPLPNLPAGKYRARLRSSAELDALLLELRNHHPDEAPLSWKTAEVTFEVTAEGPAELHPAPLELLAAP